MIQTKPRVLGVIPARGGSKGIPKKNIKLLCGKPLIAWSIEAANASSYLSEVCVSTDCEEIAKVAKDFGANIPFMRPKELAQDKSLSIDVIKHALKFYQEAKNLEFDYVMLLQPTTPLRKPQHIDEAVQQVVKLGCDGIVSLVNVGANHPARMYTLAHDGALQSVMDEAVSMRPRQELPDVYIRSGDIYLCRSQIPFTANSLMGGVCRSFIIPAHETVNIDTPLDFALAEAIFQHSSSKSSLTYFV